MCVEGGEKVENITGSGVWETTPRARFWLGFFGKSQLKAMGKINPHLVILSHVMGIIKNTVFAPGKETLPI